MNSPIIKFADLPPDPFDSNDLNLYKNLGFNVCLLTEDYVPMVSGGKLSDDYKKAIKQIGETGLSVWIRNMYNDPDYFICQDSKKGSNYGVPYELNPRTVTDEFKEFECITGFYMADEAYMYTLPEKSTLSWVGKDAELYASFDKLKNLVEWKNKYYPGLFWHMNHVPSQSWDHYMPRNGEIYSYSDFLNSYKSKILNGLDAGGCSMCIDNYPFIGEDYIEKDYLYDVLTASETARRFNSENHSAKAVFGICIQTFRAFSPDGDGRNRDIKSSGEIKFQIYTGLAAGAKLFEYFCYHSAEKLDGIIDIKGNKRIYETVRQANTETGEIENAISLFENTGTFIVPGSKCTENTPAFIMAKQYLKKPDTVEIESEYDVFAGCLKSSRKEGLLIVNFTDPIKNHINRITVKINGINEINFCDEQGVKTLVTRNGKFNFTLNPGSAVFIYY